MPTLPLFGYVINMKNFFGMAGNFASFLIIKIVNIAIFDTSDCFFLCSKNRINGIFGAQAPNI